MRSIRKPRGVPHGASTPCADTPPRTPQATHCIAESRPADVRVPLEMRAGSDVDVRVEFRPDSRFVTMRLGIAPHREDGRLIEQAATAAAAADVAVVIVGSTDGTESEGYDRDTMVLPGRPDELVRKRAAANPNTGVGIHSGKAAPMPG